MGHNSQPDCKHDSFDFATQLQFEAGSNLLRSRSDTSIRSSDSSSKIRQSSIIDLWEVSAIDFSAHRLCRPSKLKSKKEGRNFNLKTSNRHFTKLPVPKALEKPKEKDAPFVTSSRIRSAATARRLCVKNGMYRGAGTYRPLGPHAFRGDDFRPISFERLKGKPPFVTRFATDAVNLELKRKTISVLHEDLDLNDSSRPKTDPRKSYGLKPFDTSAKQKPKWQRSLVLPTEKYRKEISGDHIRMNQIVKQLSWCLENGKGSALDRPNIKDYKTVDWLQVTRHPKLEMTVLR